MASESFGQSTSQTGSRDSVAGGRSGGATSRSSRANTTGSICAFWIGQRCLGLDTGLVGEVVSIEEHVPVPLAPPAIQGIFNLRGEPLPLVSLAAILGISRPPSSAKTVTAMVLRSGDLAAGLSIDRVQAILPVRPGALTAPTNVEEDSVILGFLEVPSEKTPMVVSVLDPAALLEKVMQLRFLRDSKA